MRKIFVEILIILIVLIFILSFNFKVYATSLTDLSTQQNQLSTQQNAINSQIQDTKTDLTSVQAEKQDNLEAISSLISEISNYQSQIDDLKSQINDLQTKINETQKEINDKQAEYDKQNDLLNQRLVAVYENGNTSYLDFLLSSKSIVDFISNYYLASEVASTDTDLINSIAQTKKDIEDKKAALESDKQEINSKLNDVESTTTKLQADQVQKNAKVAALSDQEKTLESQLEELQAHESSISGKIKQMQQEYDAQKAKEASSNSNSSNGSSSSYGFGWPVANPVITTGFGEAGSNWSSGYHTGVDFKASPGTQVYSIGNGIVSDTGYNEAYGNFVEIYHGNNIYSYYAHASSVQVSEGQIVTKGQQIMLSGATGNVTGPHLHFEIRTPGYKYADCVNPTKYLP